MPPPSRPTARRDELRAEILHSALTLLAEHGAGAVTTRAVAERAGVQPPAIYRIFGDKDGLLDEVAEHVMSTFASAKAGHADDARQRGTDPVDDLRAGWQTYIDFGLANPRLFTLLSDPDRAARSPATRSGREVLVARVHRVAVAGRLRVGEPEATELLHAAATGVVLTLLAARDGLPTHPDLADSMLEAVLDRILTSAEASTAGVVPAAVALRAATGDLDALTAAERELLDEWLDRITTNGQRRTTT